MTSTNPEYERALLGCVLFDNRVLQEYKITQEFFADEINRDIWHEIEKVKARGAEANILEIGRAFPQRAVYIAGLTDSMTHGNIKMYYDELKELVKKRGFMSMLNGLSMRIRDGEPTPYLFDYTEQTLTAIADDEDTGYKHVSACLPGLIANIEDAVKRKGTLSGIDTGFPELNQKTGGWQNQTLCVIGARPGAGKTSIALNMASAALLTGKAVGFFSAEMDAKSIVKRMVSSWGRVDYKRLNSGLFAQGDMDKISEACGDIAGTRLFINDRPAIGIHDLVSEARKMRRIEKVDILFVDYLSLVKNQRRDIPRHEQVAEISKTLKQTARELDIPVVVLSQLTREAQGARPNLAQLRDSGAVEEDSDIVILLWNQGYLDESKTEVKITFIMEKHRNGPRGDIPMIFTPDRMKFRESPL
jgi:replicative DNA helicase